ncbi:MAG: DUF5685 family protein [Ruminococcus sp.]|nr:DUF5685 family protein [Ruminococcus sp.]
MTLFGYIRPFKSHMRFGEFQVYNGFYCGLCKNLGKNYGQLYRMLLSYDFAFLGILCCAVVEKPLKFEPQHCIIHPIGKKLCLKDIEALDFTAAAAVISVYQKLCDSISDTGKIKAIPYKIIKLFASRGYKKAVGKYPDIAEKIQSEMNRQFELEKKGCTSLDLACEPTAQIMSELASCIPETEEQSEIFSNFGYHLGRFVYLADAYDDAEKDKKNDNYNVLLKYSSDTEAARKLAEGNINMSLCMIADHYSKMELKRFKEILDNVIYLGLKNFSLDKKKKKSEEIVL